MNWHVYDIVPIDFGWEHLKSVKETLSVMGLSRGEGASSEGFDPSASRAFLDAWESAKAAARKKGWEGDFRHEPAVFWLPAEEDFNYAFIFKQGNNGTTFVVSPHVLPWLDHLK